MANNQMDSKMRQVCKAGTKAGWEWVLVVKAGHFRVYSPNGTLVTTVAPRNRHWHKYFGSAVKGHNYPGFA